MTMPPTDPAPLPGAIGDPRLPGYPWLPARYHGRPFRAPPTLLVIHSGATGDDVGRYIHNPLARLDDPSAKLCRDGLYRRRVSAHVSARSRNGDFVQQVAMTEIAFHAGGSLCMGRQRVNNWSIGVEAPAHRGDALDRQFLALVSALVQVVPSLEWWTLHRWISGNRRDPLPWDDEQVRVLMEGSGLVEVGR
jgi:hypothetical protein